MAAGLKKKDIKGLSVEEAEAKLSELRLALAKERSHIASGTRPENPGSIRAMRKSIARILTLLHEKKAALEKNKSGGKKKK